MNGPARVMLGVTLLLAACASGQPARAEGFDASAGRAVVTLLGGEFALLDGERLPFDAVVLRLRHRVRAMTTEQRARFVVRLEVDGSVTEATAEHAAELHDRMMLELNVMEVLQVELGARP